MKPFLDDRDAQVFVGDCREVLREMAGGSVDAVVTDPPYDLVTARGRGFMGHEWDGTGVAFDPETWREVLRVAKPGAHLVAFGGTRTFHRLMCAIEDAGWEIRDTLMWLHGQGFPKSLDVSKAIDKAAGAVREVVGSKVGLPGYSLAPSAGDSLTFGSGLGNTSVPERECEVTAPATEAAVVWDGWGTALKPAWEPVVVARKPFVGSVSENVLEHGVGAINVDGCRVAATPEDVAMQRERTGGEMGELKGNSVYGDGVRNPAGNELGRWPANVVLSHAEGCRCVGTRRVKAASRPNGTVAKGASSADAEGNRSSALGAESRPAGTAVRTYGDADGMESVEAWECVECCPVRLLDEQSGDRSSSRAGGNPNDPTNQVGRDVFGRGGDGRSSVDYRDAGGASRFFYTGKADRRERVAADGTRNTHPTVKPTDLMRWLVRLVTARGGLVLDPFAGSGSTGVACREEGFRCVLVERDEGYAMIIASRLSQQSLL